MTASRRLQLAAESSGAIRIACVAGMISPAHCAQTGMPLNGNMKFESRSDGRRVNWANWIAYIWFAATVENAIPSARLLAMNRPKATRSNATESRTDNWKNKAEAARMSTTWIQPTKI